MIHAVYDVTGCAADLAAEPLLAAMRATATLPASPSAAN
jgi:hypothetical protein